MCSDDNLHCVFVGGGGGTFLCMAVVVFLCGGLVTSMAFNCACFVLRCQLNGASVDGTSRIVPVLMVATGWHQTLLHTCKHSHEHVCYSKINGHKCMFETLLCGTEIGISRYVTSSVLRNYISKNSTEELN